MPAPKTIPTLQKRAHPLASSARQCRILEQLPMRTSFPAAVDGLMSRYTLSVGWDGRLYDCDFNQMLELKLEPGLSTSIFEATPERLESRVIQVGPHCFGCTAGAGSSCGGTTTQPQSRA